MITLHRGLRQVGGVAALALALTVATVLSAQAHHVMGGRTPETFMQGLLSGLAHPVIGLDHLAFIVAMGVAAGVATLNLAIPVVFISLPRSVSGCMYRASRCPRPNWSSQHPCC